MRARSHPCMQSPYFESKTKLSNNNRVLSGSDKYGFGSVYSLVIGGVGPRMCSGMSIAPHIVELLLTSGIQFALEKDDPGPH